MNKKDFKMLKKINYLDSAAGTLKPIQVIKAGTDFYNNYSLNPHSLESKIGVEVYERILQTRKMVADLMDASSEEIIFNSGTTDGINHLAHALEPLLKKGDEILIHYLNHSVMVITWMELARRSGAKLVFSMDILKDINSKTKLIAIAEINNTLENKTDMKKIWKAAKKQDIIVVNDAAQAIAHKKVSLKYAHAIAWSANKLYGPTGLGVLAIRKDFMKVIKPARFGGGGNTWITETDWGMHENYKAFEVGTPHTAGIFMLKAAIEYMDNIGWENVFNHDYEIACYLYDQLSSLSNVILYSKRGDTNVMFNLDKTNSQDVVSYLGHRNIILRAGQICVRLLKKVIGKDSAIRASIALYTEKKDIDEMIKALKEGGDFLEFI